MPQDLILDDNMDLNIVNGDFLIGESTYQHQKILIVADKGEFKENPMRCVGVKRYLESERPDELAREIRQEFSSDGMIVNKLQIGNDGSIEVDAFYP